MTASPVIHALGAEEPQAKTESVPVPSRVLEGKVTAIVDGDTFHLDTDEGGYLVDLAGIDAPEKGQPSGNMASQVLHLKLLDRQIRLVVVPTPTANPVVRPVAPVPSEATDIERQALRDSTRRRICGIVYYQGCVNAQLVGEGLAWHDPHTCPSRTLADSQELAKAARRGLWRSRTEPVPPWEWRTSPEQLPSVDDVAEQTGAEIDDLSRYFAAQRPPALVEAAMPRPPDPETKAAASTADSATGGTHWLTTSSGIRHNSKCRYYQKSKGRFCSAQEGRPCQKCGG